MNKKENWLNSLELVKHYQKSIKRFCLAIKPFENYGYDELEFRRLELARKLYQKRIKLFGLDTEHYYGIYSRLVLHGKQLDYVTGQSWNDEMVTLLRCFSGRQADNPNENVL